jgi:hypothetical protein
MQRFRMFLYALVGLLALLPLCSLVPPAQADRDSKTETGEIAAGFWEIAEKDQPLTLVSPNELAPVQTSLTDATQIQGVCVHCQITLQCAVGALNKRCPVCPCGLTSAACLTGKSLRDPGWRAVLANLPRGTQLHVAFNTPEKPAEGIKRLVVDRRAALLPVEGLATLTADQVQTLGKAVGARRATWNDSARQLQLDLKDDWTAARESRLEQALTKLGGKIALPQTVPPAH